MNIVEFRGFICRNKGESHGLFACHTLFDNSASGGVPAGGLWLPILVEHPLNLTRLHPGVGSRYLDHRYPVIVSAPLS